jgi:hypothetical protein
MLQVHIEQESHALLGMALQGQLELLYSKGFKPIRVYVDPQSALKSLETKGRVIQRARHRSKKKLSHLNHFVCRATCYTAGDMKVIFSIPQCRLCRHTQKSDIMRHEREKKTLISRLTATFF